MDSPKGRGSRRGRRGRPSRWDRPRPPHDWRWWVGGTGRVLVAVGLLLFAFVAYQLWGTGIQQAQAQRDLEDQFTELNASLSTTLAPTTTAAATTTTVPPSSSTSLPGSSTTRPPRTTTTSTTSTTVAPVLLEISDGDPIGVMEIPAIGVSEYVVAGVSTEDLRKGPGHYPFTPFPGELGNAGIAGHRTTYGQPFFRLDELQPGDEIIMTMLGGGRYVYRVTGQTVVGPSDGEVLATTDPTIATLTLTTCTPKYSASQRLIVTSELDAGASDPVGAVIEYAPSDDTSSGPGDPGALGGHGGSATLPGDEGETTDPPATDGPGPDTTGAVAGTTVDTPPPTNVDTTDQADPGDIGQGDTDQGEVATAFDESWFSDPDAWPQVALWGLALTAISVGAYLLSRRFRNNWVGGLVGIVPFVVALYFFFENVNRLLPPAL